MDGSGYVISVICKKMQGDGLSLEENEMSGTLIIASRNGKALGGVMIPTKNKKAIAKAKKKLTKEYGEE